MCICALIPHFEVLGGKTALATRLCDVPNWSISRYSLSSIAKSISASDRECPVNTSLVKMVLDVVQSDPSNVKFAQIKSCKKMVSIFFSLLWEFWLVWLRKVLRSLVFFGFGLYLPASLSHPERNKWIFLGPKLQRRCKFSLLQTNNKQ